MVALRSVASSGWNEVFSLCALNADETSAVFAVPGSAFVLLDLVTFEATEASGRGARHFFNIQFNAAGNRVLATGSCPVRHDRIMYVYDVKTMTLLFQACSNGIACYSWDGSYIFGSSHIELKCWDAESAAKVACPFSALGISACYEYIKFYVLALPAVILL
jgi:WD40 repeat protein